MAKYIDDGGAAFPRPVSEDDERFNEREYHHAQEGMSLRDYFAAKAIQGRFGGSGFVDTDNVAGLCYKIADAMIRARAAKPESEQV